VNHNHITFFEILSRNRIMPYFFCYLRRMPSWRLASIEGTLSCSRSSYPISGTSFWPLPWSQLKFLRSVTSSRTIYKNLASSSALKNRPHIAGLGIFFEVFDGRRYVPNAEHQARFPEDYTAALSLTTQHI
jgi:hypothetical protein